MPRIVVCGGGSGAHALAGLLGGIDDYEVRLVTRRPERWSKTIRCMEQQALLEHVPHGLTSRAAERSGRLAGVHGWDELPQALAGADLVLLSCPVHAHAALLERLLPQLAGARVALGTLFAQGGFDWHVRRIAQRERLDLSRLTLFGLKRFPFVSRVVEYGRSVRILGRFVRLLVAVDAPSGHEARDLESLLGRLFDRPTVRVPFMACTLNLSNQVLHPGIAWGLLDGHQPGDAPFAEAPPFYASCTPEAAQVMNDLTMELRQLATRLEPLVGAPVERHLGAEPSVALFLRLRDTVLLPFERFAWARWIRNTLMARAFRSNTRTSSVLLPVRPGPPGGFAPDVDSRFWTDDLPNGLCVVEGLAELVGEQLPTVRSMIRVHQGWMGRSYLVEDDGVERLCGADLGETNAPQAHGIQDLSALRAFLGQPVTRDWR